MSVIIMFSGKVVLITGGSAGIGEQVAKEFSKLGANVVITGRNKVALDKVAEMCELISPTNLKALPIIAEMNNESDLENIIKITIDHYKKLDILINNAGIWAIDSIETTNLDQYDEVMRVNVRAPYYLTMLAVPHLIKTKGNIVNVSSVAGRRSFPNVIAYCVSKSALDQFTRCIALELSLKGVRVNAVNPGVILTDLLKKTIQNDVLFENYLKNCTKTHANGRIGYKHEVSSAIVFLASDGASNVTGATLSVDGGRHVLCL